VDLQYSLDETHAAAFNHIKMSHNLLRFWTEEHTYFAIGSKLAQDFFFLKSFFSSYFFLPVTPIIPAADSKHLSRYCRRNYWVSGASYGRRYWGLGVS